MALDPVPWVIGGGALHSPEIARAMAFVALGGKPGVVGTDSLKVTAGGGGNVSIASGAVAIDNTYPGADQQMYIAREQTSSLKAIGATGGTARSDMIVVCIDDPQYGGAEPVDPAVGPYTRYDVITNVGSSATTVPGSYDKPAIALARVDLPPNTTTITAGMITDLRNAGQIGSGGGMAGTAKYHKVTRSYNPSTVIELTAAAPGAVWPNAAGWPITIPDWASKVTARAILASVRGDHHATAANYGVIWIVIGTPPGSTVTTPVTKYEVPEGPGGQDRHIIMGGGADMLIPASIRGTQQTVRIYGQRNGSVGGLNLIADTNTQVFLDVEFFEEPV